MKKKFIFASVICVLAISVFTFYPIFNAADHNNPADKGTGYEPVVKSDHLSIIVK